MWASRGIEWDSRGRFSLSLSIYLSCQISSLTLRDGDGGEAARAGMGARFFFLFFFLERKKRSDRVRSFARKNLLDFLCFFRSSSSSFAGPSTLSLSLSFSHSPVARDSRERDFTASARQVRFIEQGTPSSGGD